MPWKNGGGETIEIARGPPGASLDAFDWRISRARIDGPGPFSRFPGIDRTLCVLDGAGIALSVAGYPEQRLTQQSRPFAFDGAREAHSSLIGGVVTDLNVMTRRGKFTHRVESLAPKVSSRVSGVQNGIAVCFACRRAVIESAQPVVLEANDALMLERPDDAVTIAPIENGRVYWIEIRIDGGE